MKLNVKTTGLLSAALIAAAAIATSAQADTNTSLIEPPTYSVGTIHNVNGWKSTGAAGLDAAVFDHKVTTLSTLGLTGNPAYVQSFGTEALRISNSVASGSFSNQTFSPGTANEAGETSAESNGQSGGERQSQFDANFTIASATPGAEQPGLSLGVSADRGDGARMAHMRFIDTPAGIEVHFIDFDHATVAFRDRIVATLSNNAPHRIKLHIDFVDGIDNDVAILKIDGVDVSPVDATTWEDYFRDGEGNPTRTVDGLLFRTSGTAAPATDGFGFLIDNVALTTPAISAGPTGATGATGSGATGATGASGSNGSDGTNGTNGSNGTNGADGAAGSPAPANQIGEVTASARVSTTAAKVSGREVRVAVSCSVSGTQHCVGTLRLKKGRRQVGSAAFSLKSGQRTVAVTTTTRFKKRTKLRAYVQTYLPGGKSLRVSRTVKLK